MDNNEFLKDRIRNFSEMLKKIDAKLFDHFMVIAFLFLF
mgnify:CR=1 FL=1|jgi:hypothetical protein